MAVRPLRPAIDRRLGELLPHLPANRARAPLPAPFGFPLEIAPESSCGISSSFPELSPSRRRVTHVLLTRPPLYSTPCGVFRVRLACVRHAASVDSEPGSNSHIESIQKPVFFALSGCQRTEPAGPWLRASCPPVRSMIRDRLGRCKCRAEKSSDGADTDKRAQKHRCRAGSKDKDSRDGRDSRDNRDEKESRRGPPGASLRKAR